MKTIFFFIACSCLINGLTASFAGFALEDEENNFDKEISPELNIFFPDIKNADSLIVPFPTERTSTARTTAGFTTTSAFTTDPTQTTYPSTSPKPTPTITSTTTRRPTRIPTSTTFRPTLIPTSTTSRPTLIPTSTTSRPTLIPTSTTSRPTHPPTPYPTTTVRPRPELERIQIYNNAFRSLGPLAGRLVNVVLNSGINQKTVQQNEILYNLRPLKVDDEED